MTNIDEITEWQPSEQLQKTASLLFAQRKDHLGRTMRDKQSDIAEEMSARGLGRSGAFHGAVNRAFVDLFNEFGIGLLDDYLRLAEDVRLAPEPNRLLATNYKLPAK